MKALIGLGNPDEKYLKNRHNVGFMFVDFVAQMNTQSLFKYNKYMHAEIDIMKDKLIIAKPQTFMNRSGGSVKKISTSYKLPATSLFITHDDLDIPLGKFKIQHGVGPKMHNGIESIEKALGTKDFWRIRVGVENRNTERRISGEEYVLQNFTEEEKNLLLSQVFPAIYTRLTHMKLGL